MAKTEQIFHQINFGPLAQNVLDYVDRTDLFKPDRTPVVIKRYGSGFDLWIAGEREFIDLSNIQASYALNCMQVGIFNT